ncbi:hypothetical protein T11_12568, partial [Trichinella zimbabwensis]
MKNFVLCLLFLAVLVSGQSLFKKKAKAEKSEDALKEKIKSVESWIEKTRETAKNQRKVDELLNASSSTCPSECKAFFQESPSDQKFLKCLLCVLKCQKK